MSLLRAVREHLEWSIVLKPQPPDATASDMLDVESMLRRSVDAVAEVVPTNSWYGHAAVVRAFAGLGDSPLKVALPHGLEYSGVPLHRRREPVPVVIHYAPPARQLYESQGSRFVWPLMAPYAMLGTLQPLADGERRGTLFFFDHAYSSPETGLVLDESRDPADLAKILVGLGPDWQPITVCLFWLDVLEGRHIPFLDAGLHVVCAGRREDPQFLVRLRHLVRTHRRVASCDLTSGVYYGIYEGCEYRFLDAPGQEFGTEAMRAIRRRTSAGARALSDAPAQEQRQVADDLIRGGGMFTADDVQRLLDAADRLDRFGYTRLPAVVGSGVVVAPPHVLLRPLARLRRIARRAIGAKQIAPAAP